MMLFTTATRTTAATTSQKCSGRVNVLLVNTNALLNGNLLSIHQFKYTHTHIMYACMCVSQSVIYRFCQCIGGDESFHTM